MCPRHVLPSRVMVPSSQLVRTVVQEVLSVPHALVAGGVVAWVGCTYPPHLVHLLTFLSLLGNVSRVMLPSPQPVRWVWQELLSVAHAMVA